MYLKKMEGPRAVKLPDGSVMTHADLPSRNTSRWVASRKAAVIKGVASGLISQAQACEKYGLSAEEFSEWCHAVHHHGEKGLRVTVSQKDRQPQV